jgi:hypothetical protein
MPSNVISEELCPVSDHPAVKQAYHDFSAAVRALEAARREYGRINALLSTHADQSREGMHHDPIETAEAEAKLPEAKKDHALAEVQKLRAEQQVKATVERVKAKLDRTRAEQRKPLVRAIEAALEPAYAGHDALTAFDAETARLGGSRVEYLYPWLSLAART